MRVYPRHGPRQRQSASRPLSPEERVSEPYLWLGCALGYDLGVEVVLGDSRQLIAGGAQCHLTHGEQSGEEDREWTPALPRRTMARGEARLWRRDLEPSGAERRLIEPQSPSSAGEADVSSRRKKSDGHLEDLSVDITVIKVSRQQPDTKDGQGGEAFCPLLRLQLAVLAQRAILTGDRGRVFTTETWLPGRPNTELQWHPWSQQLMLTYIFPAEAHARAIFDPPERTPRCTPADDTKVLI
ncbi:hypothetical protein QBC39DRAFT_32869 [Podospora conica]|nr:hypothetical protein QBC39DRAFT_32869 [Schizothecium conicum]